MRGAAGNAVEAKFGLNRREDGGRSSAGVPAKLDRTAFHHVSILRPSLDAVLRCRFPGASPRAKSLWCRGKGCLTGFWDWDVVIVIDEPGTSDFNEEEYSEAIG